MYTAGGKRTSEVFSSLPLVIIIYKRVMSQDYSFWHELIYLYLIQSENHLTGQCLFWLTHSRINKQDWWKTGERQYYNANSVLQPTWIKILALLFITILTMKKLLISLRSANLQNRDDNNKIIIILSTLKGSCEI